MTTIASHDLRQVTDLYHQGRYLQAFQASQELGPLEQWQGTQARVWAGRLVNNLGAPRLARVLHQLAWRADPEDADARYFHVLALISRRDTLSVWRVIRGFGELPGASESRRADWFALISHVMATLRDFENADKWFERAQELRPKRPWIWVERSATLAMQDQPALSLEAAQRALEHRPWFRPAVQATASALVQLGRDDEALDLLKRAMQKIESGNVLAQLALLQTELGQFEQGRDSYERLAEYFPLAGRDKLMSKWLASRRADAAYYCGDYARAVELAESLDDTFHKKVVERLKQGTGDGKRVFLPVEYVRQHHVTCAGHADLHQFVLVEAGRSFGGRRTDLLRRHAGP